MISCQADSIAREGAVKAEPDPLLSGANGWHSSVIPWGQKIEPAPPLSPAWPARIGKTWLPVNYAFEDDYIGPGADPRILLASIEGADGYVFSSGPDGIMTTRPAQAGGDSETRSTRYRRQRSAKTR